MSAYVIHWPGQTMLGPCLGSLSEVQALCAQTFGPNWASIVTIHALEPMPAAKLEEPAK